MKDTKPVSIYSRVKDQIHTLADKQVRLGDAVIVGSLIGIGVLALVMSRGNVYISFDSREKHRL